MGTHLARVAELTDDLGENGGREQEQYLTFRLGQETYAMGILSIKEILEYGGLTTVPMMPLCVRGVINLRGRVVPVVDLAVRFGREPTRPGQRTCIVIVDLEVDGVRQDIGVIVDAVNQVLEIPAAEVEPTPSFGSRLRTDFVAGMGKVDSEFVAILNVNRVFAIDEIAEFRGGTSASNAEPVFSSNAADGVLAA